MNVFHKYTRASLRQNRSRTLITVVGILLSMALFTAVIEGAYSGLQFLIRCEVYEAGTWQGYFHDLTADEAARVQGDKEMKDLSLWQEVGWAEIGSANEYKPYLYVQAIDDRAAELTSIRLIDGRLPENEHELLLPTHLAANGDVHYKTGDTLTLQLGWMEDAAGDRLTMNSGYPAWEAAWSGEGSWTDAEERTYTVVGTYERFDYGVEDFGCPGYFALTAGEGRGAWSVFFTLKHPAAFYDYMAKFLEETRLTDTYRVHDYLLNFYGSLRNPGVGGMLYGFAGVLVFLIAFGSVSLIYNSFAISVSERTRQFGILKSVGATKKQIRGSVLYEALLLSAIAIPLGLLVGVLGIGLVLYFLRDAFSILSAASRAGAVQMGLVLNPTALVVAALVCLVTTLISAWIPALRAVRVTPIQAIRQTQDVKLRKRDVRTWGLTKKLFGFEGMMASKNFGRNRKRYRAVIISLFLSVTLFISASSFCAYLTDAVNAVVSEGTARYDLVYRGYGEENDEERETLFAALNGVEGVEQGTWFQTFSEDLAIPAEACDRSFQNSMTYLAERPAIYAQIRFLRDEDFRQLCKENGLDPARYFDPTAPKAPVLNEVTHAYFTEEGRHWETFTVLRSGAMPTTCTITVFPEMVGYYCAGFTEDGAHLIYYPEEYWTDLWNSWYGEDGEPQGPAPEPDPAMGTLVEPEQLHLTADGVISKPDFSMANGEFTLIYPASMKEAVFGDGEYHPTMNTNYVFAAPEHLTANEKMETVLTDLGQPKENLNDVTAENEGERMLVKVVNVFSYGFIILISLIALANVFNTISTSVSLRRREFAMLKSIGLGEKGFRKMMNYECLIYGFRSLLWGLPAAVLMTWVIWKVTGFAVDAGFYVPWYSVTIAVGSVFLVVFATMLYATRRIKRDNPIDALKTETL